MNFGRVNKMVEENLTKKGVREGFEKTFEFLGKPGHMRGGKMDEEALRAMRMRSGRRRAAVVGGALVLNHRIGPSGSRSTGGRGYVQPRSTGGYA